MLKKLLLWAALASWAGYCYSDSIAPYFGTTPNAAAGGNTWGMDSVLPNGVPGVDINLIIYSYTPQKITADDMIVHIQNENASGTGYIFRESDDWSGLPGGTEIRKVVPVVPSNRSLWGTGSIEVEGTGTVEEPFVFYNYRVDPCYDPQYDPNCPGYVQPQPPEIETVDVDSLYDPLADSAVTDALASTDADQYDDEEAKSEEDKKKEEEEEEQDSKERLEKALAAADSTLMFAEALAQSQLLQSMNMAINMNSYYSANIDGGTYKEPITLVDTQLPENKQGLRNGFAQQLLHEKMVEMQYK